jgi:hypothetical protein
VFDYNENRLWMLDFSAPAGVLPVAGRVVAAHGDYVLTTWATGTYENPSDRLLAVQDRTGKVLATSPFGPFQPFEDEPRTTTVSSPNDRWLIAQSDQASVAIDLLNAKAAPLESGLRLFSVTDDGTVYALKGAAPVTVDSATGSVTWTGDSTTRLPSAVVDGMAVVGSNPPDTVLSGQHTTAGAWALGSAQAAVAARLAPMVWLAQEDRTRPADAGWFISHSRLMWAHDQDCRDELITSTVDESALAHGAYRHRIAVNRNPVGLGVPVDCPAADHLGREYRSDENTHPFRADDPPGREGFYLDLANKFRSGIGTVAPTYWEYRKGENGRGAYVFWFFYAYNDYLNKHEGDWERIAVQVDGENPTGVVFWKHELPPCLISWDADALDKTDDGHAVIYSAKNAHGSYPDADKHLHPGGIDHTSQGSRWQTWGDVRDVRAERWYGFGGGWGEASPPNLPLAGHSSGPDGPNPRYDKASGALTDTRCDGLAKEFAGTWESTELLTPTASVPGSNVTVTIKFDAKGKAVTTVIYSQWGCSGELYVTESSADRAVFAQQITKNSVELCANGTVTLTRDGSDLAFTMVPEPVNTPTYTARLRKQ